MTAQVGSHNYRTERKLDVFQQLRVAKRLVLFLPLFSDANSQVEQMKKEQVQLSDNPSEAASEARKSLTLSALSQLSDEDSRMVVLTCLGVVTRESTANGVYAKV